MLFHEHGSARRNGTGASTPVTIRTTRCAARRLKQVARGSARNPGWDEGDLGFFRAGSPGADPDSRRTSQLTLAA